MYSFQDMLVFDFLYYIVFANNIDNFNEKNWQKVVMNV